MLNRRELLITPAPAGVPTALPAFRPAGADLGRPSDPPLREGLG